MKVGLKRILCAIELFVSSQFIDNFVFKSQTH
jgi:hypothetical protein